MNKQESELEMNQEEISADEMELIENVVKYVWKQVKSRCNRKHLDDGDTSAAALYHSGFSWKY